MRILVAIISFCLSACQPHGVDLIRSRDEVVCRIPADDKWPATVVGTNTITACRSIGGMSYR